eukprot:CAMPEP_0172486158 /NCGR_PEP_ID=MMETSP1066-20121228/14605_1 /TAXON_ID=671091 /ORGANISM="Coscinodiscus wailesii, Strain CCMP2513" /LENGTH=328 /DNA_ID=CAMNT_0013251927 /DNA_START=936 /DNA_END=1919 /DNA_ORIENTATION=+
MTHINVSAWLALMGVVNLIYFVLGIVIYVTKDQLAAGEALTMIFLGQCVLFVLVSWALYEKMKIIFYKIMHTDFIDRNETESNTAPDDEEIPESVEAMKMHQSAMNNSSHMPRRLNQMDLFWTGNPHFVLTLIQFMQFGYAISLAALLLFWKYINVYYAPVKFLTLVMVFAVSYILFIIFVARIIPRYTLCTSLGELVNHRRLSETLAEFRLEEAAKKRRYNLDYSVHDASKMPASDTAPEGEPTVATAESDQPVQVGSINVHASPIPSKTPPKPPPSTTDRASGLFSDSEDEDAKRMNTLASLVLKDTKDLPEIPPYDKIKQRRERR